MDLSIRMVCPWFVVLILAGCNLTTAPSTIPTAIPLQPVTLTVEQQPTATLSSATFVEPTSALQLSVTPALGGERPSSLQSAIIISPTNGSTVSGNPLQLSGVVYGLPRDSFVLEMLNNAGTVINRQTITLRNPNNFAEVSWSAALMTQYRGAAVIRLVAQDRLGDDYVAASVSVTIGEGGGSNVAIPQTTTSPYAIITQPISSATVAGNPIQVSGSAGGIFENVFTLELRAANNTLLNSQPITLTSSDPSLVVPWSASLGTSGYMGQAELRVVYFRPSDGQSQTLAATPVILN